MDTNGPLPLRRALRIGLLLLLLALPVAVLALGFGAPHGEQGAIGVRAVGGEPASPAVAATPVTRPEAPSSSNSAEIQTLRAPVASTTTSTVPPTTSTTTTTAPPTTTTTAPPAPR